MTDEPPAEPAPSERGRLRRGVSGVSVASRIASAVVTVSLLSLIIATVIGLDTGRDLARQLYDDQITGMRTAGAGNGEAYLNTLERNVEALATSPNAADTVEGFSAAADELTHESAEAREEALETLANEYQEMFLEPLGEAGRTVDLRDVLSGGNDAATYLQSNYSIDFAPLSKPSGVDDARDGSEWSAIHARIHPTFRRIANRLELSDVLLVDTDTGRIVYTTEKRPDLGASVDLGPVSGSIVSTLVDRIRDDPDGGVQAADFRRYDPSVLTPVAGVAAPVLDDGEQLVGALIFLFDSSELTRILTADGGWESSEFTEGADIYFIGSDGTTRSEPRGYTEDAEAYLDDAQATGRLNDADRAVIDLSGTTVLALSADEATTTAADDAVTDAERRTTIDGRTALSSVEQLDYDGFPLWAVAEVEAAAAEQSLEDFEALLIVGVAIFMVVLAFIAVAWSTSIVRPVRALSDRLAERPSENPKALEVPDQSPIEFHRLAARFDTMGTVLRSQHRQLADARTERLALMKRMLPAAVAERLAAGDPLSLDESPDASVVVLTLNGLAGPDEAGQDSDERRSALEVFLGELDGVARHHGLEPIKLIGDEYYATIGHERPYIDHAPRAIAFVADAFDLAAEGPLPESFGLGLSAGVASGSVTVGLTGTSGLVYDVWGTTVRRADQLARRAGTGTVLVSDDTAGKLPDSVSVTAYQEVTGEMAWMVDLEGTGESA